MEKLVVEIHKNVTYKKNQKELHDDTVYFVKEHFLDAMVKFHCSPLREGGESV